MKSIFSNKGRIDRIYINDIFNNHGFVKVFMNTIFNKRGFGKKNLEFYEILVSISPT